LPLLAASSNFKDHLQISVDAHPDRGGSNAAFIEARKMYEAAKEMSPVLLARLEYAARGWWTFPAPADGSKKSLKYACEATNYVNWGATLSAKVIHSEFNGGWFNSRLRDQNVGIVTGIESDIFVIETDTSEHGEGIDGAAVLKAKEKRNGKLPKTLMARSPSDSIHRYFRHPGKGIKVKSASAIFGNGSGVDCKGDGGMVLGVPSYRPPKPATADKPAKSGGHYQWVNEGHDVVDAPQWLLDVVTPNRRNDPELGKMGPDCIDPASTPGRY
jgi:hypothetical protein